MADYGSVGKDGFGAVGGTDAAHYSVAHLYYGQVAKQLGAETNAALPSPNSGKRIPLPLGDALFTSE